MPDDPPTPTGIFASIAKRGLWAGRRKWWTAAFLAGVVLLAADYVVLDFGKSDHATPLALAVFWLCLTCTMVGALGHNITDIVEERREKRARRR